MYLQITTKCNMKCDHCCYSCGKWGKHGEYETIIDAIAFIRNWNDETISIGGGEPTLHPRFFDILKYCLEDFDSVWMATNGSKTKTMFRLANIIDQCDWESFDSEDYCICETQEEKDNCHCEPEGLIYQEDKLTVALSQDPFHNPIDQRIVDLWTRRSIVNNYNNHPHFEIRNTYTSTQGLSNSGRAKKNQLAYSNHCPCSSLLIKPNGKIKLCGCSNSPIIGDVWNGIEDKWEKIIDSDKFKETNCYQSLKKRRK